MEEKLKGWTAGSLYFRGKSRLGRRETDPRPFPPWVFRACGDEREEKFFLGADIYIYIYTWTRAELHASCNSARPVVFYADLNHILEE